jgi:hypothetical protein
MPEGTPPTPGEEPERPEPWPTEPFGPGSRPTEPLGPPQYGGGPPTWARPPGPPGYGHPAPPQTDSGAIAALIITIAGFFICPPVGGVVGLILALNAERRIRESGGRLTGLDQARIAKVIAIVELALVLLGVLLVVLIVVFANANYP